MDERNRPYDFDGGRERYERGERRSAERKEPDRYELARRRAAARERRRRQEQRRFIITVALLVILIVAVVVSCSMLGKDDGGSSSAQGGQQSGTQQSGGTTGGAQTGNQPSGGNTGSQTGGEGSGSSSGNAQTGGEGSGSSSGGEQSGEGNTGGASGGTQSGEGNTGGTVTTERPSYDEIAAAIVGLKTELRGYGPGNNVDADNRPTIAIGDQTAFEKYGMLAIAPKSNNIYLTFDEGYENGYTTQILDVLKEKGVTAVFFVTMDYVRSQPELVQRMIDEGHVIGNHSVNHKSMPTLTTQECIDEIWGLHEYMVENFGYNMTLFRPPEGSYSEATLKIASMLGYTTMLWSFAYADWSVDNQPDISEAYDKVTGKTHGGAIYLLHAVSSTNTAILGDVIDYWQDSGYTVGAYTEW